MGTIVKRVHIIKRETGWAVKIQGHSRATGIFATKKSAIKEAQPYKTKGYDLIIHKTDGTIEKWERAMTTN